MRALTGRERIVLEAMLARGIASAGEVTAEDRERWLSQLSSTKAGRACGCGTCPSIELTNESGRSPDASEARIVLEAEATAGLLLLFIDDDRLSYLEFAPLSDLPVLEFPELLHTSLNG